MKVETWKNGILVPVERPMEQAKGCCRLTDLGQLAKEGLFWLDQKQLDRKAEKLFVAEKCVLIVLYAAGAMAAPMLLASLMPQSVTVPTVTSVMNGPAPSFPNIIAPDAVAVHWAVGVR